MAVKVPDAIRDVLEEHGVVQAPKLPSVEAMAKVAQMRGGEVSILWSPDDNGQGITSAKVRLRGHTGQHDDPEPGISLAFALADVLEKVDPQPQQQEMDLR